MIRTLRGAALAALVLVLATLAPATAELAEPLGEVILTVSGPAADGGAPVVARFDRAMLEALPQATVTTSTDWTEGVKAFTGPLARDVLAAAGIAGETVDAGALNDYHVSFPASDFAAWDVVLALTMDGQQLSVRDKGPIWIVYPRDDHPELANPEVNARWIWQLSTLDLD